VLFAVADEDDFGYALDAAVRKARIEDHWRFVQVRGSSRAPFGSDQSDYLRERPTGPPVRVRRYNPREPRGGARGSTECVRHDSSLDVRLGATAAMTLDAAAAPRLSASRIMAGDHVISTATGTTG